jgi:hypothetical protein
MHPANNKSPPRVMMNNNLRNNGGIPSVSMGSTGMMNERNIPKTARNDRKKSWFTGIKKKGKSPPAPSR